VASVTCAVPNVQGETNLCNYIIGQAEALAGS